MKDVPKKMAFVFGDVAMTLTPDDIEAVYEEWQKENPGKRLRELLPAEFSKRVLERMKTNAKPTRTVLHN